MTTGRRLAQRSFETVCGELDRRSRVALGFERIRALLEKLANPHEELKTVQVVGTNGKGTTAVALAGALEAAGVRSGAYLSPHVLSYTERIMLGGERVSEQDFAAVFDDVITLADRHEVPATQFELLTAVALKLLRDTRVAWAGLGECVDDARKHSPRVHVWSTSLYSRWFGRQQLPRYEFPQLVTNHLLRHLLTSRYMWSLRPRTAYEGAECPLRERCSLC